jgi:TRAP-type C4-dicarboxylate transport system permease large subunit
VPVILKFGVDPVQFGIVLVMNLTIAGITPPVGQMMFISCAVLRVPMEVYAVEILPFLGAMTAVLLLVTLVPGVSLWLPDLLMGP